MLNDGKVTANIPAADLKRARAFYADRLGLTPSTEIEAAALLVYDLPGVEWNDGIASMGPMGRAAWFKDSEGNILCLDDGIPAV